MNDMLLKDTKEKDSAKSESVYKAIEYYCV